MHIISMALQILEVTQSGEGTWDGTAELDWRDKLSGVKGDREKSSFLCSADHKKD